MIKNIKSKIQNWQTGVRSWAETVPASRFSAGAGRHILRIIQIAWRFIPSFRRLGFFSKIALTVFLAGICADIFYAKINSALPLLQGALSFSPQTYAEEQVKKGHLKTAEEYIEFYGSIPGVTLSREMRELAEDIHKERTGIVSGGLHQIKHAYKGLKGQESDEFIGQAADMAADFTGAGDFRDLYREYRNYSEGRDVDKLSAGLGGIGAAMTLGELAGTIGGIVTGGTATAAALSLCEPVKRMSLGIKKALKFMNPRLKKAAQNLFEPVFKRIADARLLDRLPLNPGAMGAGSWKDQLTGLARMANPEKWRSYFKANVGKISDISRFAAERMSALEDIAKLASKDPVAAKLIVENSTNIRSMTSLSKMALKLDDSARTVFRFGGKDALNAMERLGREGKLSSKTLKESMRLGPDGLKAVAKGCWRSLARMVDLIRKYAPLLWWFMLQMFLARIPFALALGLEALAGAVILKSWGAPWLTPSHPTAPQQAGN